MDIFQYQWTIFSNKKDRPKKQAGVDILLSNKRDAKPKLIKGKFHQGDISFLNICAPNVKEIFLKPKLYIDLHT